MAAAAEKQGFLTFLLRGAVARLLRSCRHCSGRAGCLPQQPACLSGVLLSLNFGVFIKALCYARWRNKRERKSRTVILTADLFSHKKWNGNDACNILWQAALCQQTLPGVANLSQDPEETSPAAGAGRPLTLHGCLGPGPAGDFYSDRRPASPVLGLGPLAKFVRPKAFLWEDAGLSSCSLAMIKVRLVPKTLSFYSLILAFFSFFFFKPDGNPVFSAVINLNCEAASAGRGRV